MAFAYGTKRWGVPGRRIAAEREMNDLSKHANIFEGIRPFLGYVPQGYLVDFLGSLTDARFRTVFGVDPLSVGGGEVQTRLPTIADGEGWFEAVNWVETTRE